MFKLLMFFVISILFLIMIYSCVQAIKKGSKPVLKDSGLEGYIQNLKDVIKEAEISAKAGMEDAEAKLADYKEKLKKAELYKQKTNNL